MCVPSVGRRRKRDKTSKRTKGGKQPPTHTAPLYRPMETTYTEVEVVRHTSRAARASNSQGSVSAECTSPNMLYTHDYYRKTGNVKSSGVEPKGPPRDSAVSCTRHKRLKRKEATDEMVQGRCYVTRGIALGLVANGLLGKAWRGS